MTIYFDENKEAYSQKETIDKFGLNCICQIEGTLWQKFNAKDVGVSWDIVNGTFTDLTNSENYKTKILAEQNAAKKAEIQAQIDSLDLKSIRALREGGIKDETTGQTWVEYYKTQIETLREYLNNL